MRRSSKYYPVLVIILGLSHMVYSQECSPPEEIACIWGGILYPDIYNCKKYYACIASSQPPSHLECRDGQLFDTNTRRCLSEDQVECLCQVSIPTTTQSSQDNTQDNGVDFPNPCEEVFCNEWPNFTKFPDPYDCKKYFECRGNSMHSKNCGRDQWFDQELMDCLDDESAVSCFPPCKGTDKQTTSASSVNTDTHTHIPESDIVESSIPDEQPPNTNTSSKTTTPVLKSTSKPTLPTTTIPTTPTRPILTTSKSSTILTTTRPTPPTSTAPSTSTPITSTTLSSTTVSQTTNPSISPTTLPKTTSTTTSITWTPFTTTSPNPFSSSKPTIPSTALSTTPKSNGWQTVPQRTSTSTTTTTISPTTEQHISSTLPHELTSTLQSTLSNQNTENSESISTSAATDSSTATSSPPEEAAESTIVPSTQTEIPTTTEDETSTSSPTTLFVEQSTTVLTTEPNFPTTTVQTTSSAQTTTEQYVETTAQSDVETTTKESTVQTTTETLTPTQRETTLETTIEEQETTTVEITAPSQTTSSQTTTEETLKTTQETTVATTFESIVETTTEDPITTQEQTTQQVTSVGKQDTTFQDKTTTMQITTSFLPSTPDIVDTTTTETTVTTETPLVSSTPQLTTVQTSVEMTTPEITSTVKSTTVPNEVTSTVESTTMPTPTSEVTTAEVTTVETTPNMSTVEDVVTTKPFTTVGQTSATPSTVEPTSTVQDIETTTEQTTRHVETSTVDDTTITDTPEVTTQKETTNMDSTTTEIATESSTVVTADSLTTRRPTTESIVADISSTVPSTTIKTTMEDTTFEMSTKQSTVASDISTAVDSTTATTESIQISSSAVQTPDETSTTPSTTSQSTVGIESSTPAISFRTTVGEDTTIVIPESTACNRVLPCKLDMKLPDPTNCKKFYQCEYTRRDTETEWRSKVCTGDEQFDSETLMCSSTYTCQKPCSTPEVPEVTTTTAILSTTSTQSTSGVDISTTPNPEITSSDGDTTTQSPSTTGPSEPGDATAETPEVTQEAPVSSTASPGFTGSMETEEPPQTTITANIITDLVMERQEDPHDSKDLTFVCSADLTTTNKPWRFTWYLNNTRLNGNGDRISITEGFGAGAVADMATVGSTLMFKPVYTGDQGTMRCSIQILDSGEESSVSEPFSVLPRPLVTLMPMTVTVYENSKVNLTCKAGMRYTEHPGKAEAPTFFWYQDGNEIEVASGTKTTGDNCVTSCVDVANGDYQSCHGCGVFVNCYDGIMYDDRQCPEDLVWDDKVKRCEYKSSTCRLTEPYQAPHFLDGQFFNYLSLIYSASSTISCVAENAAGKSNARNASIVVVKRDDLQICPSETLDGISWTLTKVGMANKQMCPEPSIGEATRRCLVNDKRNAYWDEPNLNMCVDPVFLEVLIDIQRIEDGMGSDDPDVLEAVTEHLETITITSGSTGLSPGNLNAATQSTINLARVRKKDPNVTMSNGEFTSMVETVSNVISEENMGSWASLKRDADHRSSGVMEAIDTYQEIAMIQQEDGANIVIPSSNLLVEVMSIRKDELDEVAFPNQNENLPPWLADTGDVIILRKDTLDGIANDIPGNALGVSGSYYKTINEILPVEESNTFLNTKVMSMSIGSAQSGLFLSPPVSLAFTHTSDVSAEMDNDNITVNCSFWDFAIKAGRGGWSSEGCRVVNSTGTDTQCECDHLTNFAILMSPSRIGGIHHEVLTIISIVGCVISIGGLVLTIFLYISLWKHLKSHHAVVLINLCIALIIANVLFLTGVTATGNKDACTAIAALLHYFYLAAFFIMLVEGIELLLYIVYVFHVRRKRETAALIFAGWFIPAVIVGISLGITRTKGYGNDDFCWLELENGLIWAFVGPVLCIIFANFVIIVVVIRRVATAKLHKTDKTKYHKVRAAVWNLLVITPILGVTWVFGVFAVNEQLVAFQYVFAIFNSLQGLFIFIFHALCNKKKGKYSVKTTSSSRKTSNGSHLKTNSTGTKSNRSNSTDLKPLPPILVNNPHDIITINPNEKHDITKELLNKSSYNDSNYSNDSKTLSTEDITFNSDIISDYDDKMTHSTFKPNDLNKNIKKTDEDVGRPEESMEYTLRSNSVKYYGDAKMAVSPGPTTYIDTTKDSTTYLNTNIPAHREENTNNLSPKYSYEPKETTNNLSPQQSGEPKANETKNNISPQPSWEPKAKETVSPSPSVFSSGSTDDYSYQNGDHPNFKPKVPQKPRAGALAEAAERERVSSQTSSTSC